MRGAEASGVTNAVKNGTGNFGFNAANDTYGDMIEMGILDPTKVVRSALQFAASIASLNDHYRVYDYRRTKR